jgi:hypothetical protein
VRVAYRWVHRTARLLENKEHLAGSEVKLRLGGLLGAMSCHRAAAGALEPAIPHFLKVTRSYWPGLFHCYDVPDLPRTNNELEQLFGANRYHERRATGRKAASPALVLRGSVRVVAATASRLRTFSVAEIAPEHIGSWRVLRESLEARRQQRTLRYRFRRDPESYLAKLETDLLKLTLPP